MEHSSRMAALLCELRRERNGAAADAMSFRGSACGLNLGVSIPAIRTVASAFAGGHDFAMHLYKEDVRELRIAALWLADAECVDESDFDFWADGIINSEIAEQAAMSLLAHVKCADALLGRWCAAGELLSYAALMSAGRNEYASPEAVLHAVRTSLESYPDSRLAGHGAVAAVMALFAREPHAARTFVSSLDGDGYAVQHLRDETSWRMEF